MLSHIRSIKHRACLPLVPLALALGCSAQNPSEKPDQVGIQSEALAAPTTLFKIKVKVLSVTKSGVAPSPPFDATQKALLDDGINAANQFYAPAKIKFEVIPGVTDIALTDCSDASLTSAGSTMKGFVPAFYCGSNETRNAADFTGNWWRMLAPNSFGHEVGHYLGLHHTFHECWMPQDEDTSDPGCVPQPLYGNKKWFSIESCIRGVLNHNVPLECYHDFPSFPMNGSPTQVRDFLLDGDGVADTVGSLWGRPGVNNICSTPVAPLKVDGPCPGCPMQLDFAPSSNNPMGYLDCRGCATGACANLTLSNGQLGIAQDSMFTGIRNHLISKTLDSAQAEFSDGGLWNNAKYYATIDFPSVSLDNAPDVCGRGSLGIVCGLGNQDGTFGQTSVWSSTFSDTGGWGDSASYYSTIRFPHVGGSIRKDVCGRSGSGIKCGISNDSTGFSTPTIWSSAFNDAGGWNAIAYYSTIAYPDVNNDGLADVCARGKNGIYCGTSTGSSFANVNVWESFFSDAGGWNGPSYYSTLQFANVNGVGGDDVCARSSVGIYCAISDGTAFTNRKIWTAAFSDTGGWGAAEFYSTIRFVDVNGDNTADVCGRGADGIYCGLSDGDGFGAVTRWTTSFGDSWGQEEFYSTIKFVDVNGDGWRDVCGRGAAGMYCAFNDGSSHFVDFHLHSATPTDAAGWSATSQYATLRFGPLQANTAKVELCGRASNGILCERP